MVWTVILVVTHAAAFVAGVLFGRKNSKRVENGIKAVKGEAK